jgi:hypothetical protein
MTVASKLLQGGASNKWTWGGVPPRQFSIIVGKNKDVIMTGPQNTRAHNALIRAKDAFLKKHNYTNFVEIMQQMRDNIVHASLKTLDSTAPDERNATFEQLSITHGYLRCEQLFFIWAFNLLGDDPERQIGHNVDIIDIITPKSTTDCGSITA